MMPLIKLCTYVLEIKIIQLTFISLLSCWKLRPLKVHWYPKYINIRLAVLDIYKLQGVEQKSYLLIRKTFDHFPNYLQ